MCEQALVHRDSALVAARDGDDRLSEEELVAFGVTLLVAGHETTVDMLANAVYTLFERPDLFQRLRDDPDLLPATIEELVRHIRRRRWWQCRGSPPRTSSWAA